MKMSRIPWHLFQKLLGVSFTPGEQRGTETWPCIRWLLERLRHPTERSSVLELDDIVWYDEDNEGQGQFIYARTRHGLRIGPSEYVIVPTTHHCLVRVFEQRTHWPGSRMLFETWYFAAVCLWNLLAKSDNHEHKATIMNTSSCRFQSPLFEPHTHRSMLLEFLVFSKLLRDFQGTSNNIHGFLCLSERREATHTPVVFVFWSRLEKGRGYTEYFEKAELIYMRSQAF
jgi:hypothetical protein